MIFDVLSLLVKILFVVALQPYTVTRIFVWRGFVVFFGLF